MPNTTRFASTSHGLDRQSPPYRLFEKAKQFGIWNPSDIDFTQDIADWATMSDEQKTVLGHLTSIFQAGEEAVTLDLLPLISVIAQEGRIEEEMYLTTFLWEEAKHTDFFSRWLTEVATDLTELSRFETASYKVLFHDKLPTALNALRTDASPRAQVIASVTYNMIVEGVLAETGYHAYFTALERQDLFPGVREGIYRLKQDESRHIAYGIYLLSRLISAEPTLWDIAETTLNELLPIAMTIINEPFILYDPMPFPLDQNEFAMYAMGQYQKRIARLQKARTTSLTDIIDETNALIASP